MKSSAATFPLNVALDLPPWFIRTNGGQLREALARGSLAVGDVVQYQVRLNGKTSIVAIEIRSGPGCVIATPRDTIRAELFKEEFRREPTSLPC